VRLPQLSDELVIVGQDDHLMCGTAIAVEELSTTD
jgi:hypothetical protein